MLQQDLLTLSEAARRLPRRSSGKPVHVATVYRWARDGCRGIRLQTLQVGHQAYTTEAALMEFISRLTALRRESNSDQSEARPESIREADAAAERALRRQDAEGRSAPHEQDR